MPSAVNVSTNTGKISPITRGDIFGMNFLENDQKRDKSTLLEILQVFWTLSYVDSQCVYGNGGF